MPGAYFVSDLHITAPDSDRGRLFLGFLRSLSAGRGTRQLFLLGDVFDLWVAQHRYFVDRYRDIVTEIRRLVHEGVDVHYFEGNHDLHLERFWQQQLGVTVHPGPIYADVGDLRLRLEHGDEMDPDDKGYLFLRWFLRTPPIRFLITHLPGSLVAWIGDRASATSRAYTSETKTISNDKAIDKIRAHARKAYASEPFDVIITGHVHVRDDYRAPDDAGGFRSINLGSWLDRPCYLAVGEDGIVLTELAGPDQDQLQADDRAANG